MSTVAWAIEQTKRHLGATGRIEMNQLQADLTAGATTVQLNSSLTIGAVSPGSVLGLDDELMYVLSATSSQATVSRGYMGTTASAHTSGALIEVNPRWPRAFVYDALLDEIRSLGPKLFQPVSTTYTVTADTTVLDVGATYAGFFSVLDVRRSPDQSTTMADDTWPRTKVEVRRGLPASSFSSGAAIMFPGGLGYDGTLAVTFAMPFTVSAFSESADLVATVGLAESMQDVPPVGAAIRLLAGREVVRTDTHAVGERRISQDVPAGHITSTVEELRKLRDQRIYVESRRLLTLWPTRIN